MTDYYQESSLHQQKVGVWVDISRSKIIGLIYFMDIVIVEAH